MERDTSASVPAVLLLLQLMDSAFPIGAFAHSYGLEQAVRDHRVQDASGVEAFVAALLEMQAVTADARALVQAHRAASTSELDAVISVDHEFFATKAPLELRRASTTVGRRLLQEVTAHAESSAALTEAYLAAVEREVTPGTHPVALATVGASLGLGATELVAGLLFSTANTLHSAAMRLLPVSHRDAQAALHRHRTAIRRLAEEAASDREPGYASFFPLQEIAAARHEGAAVRFFAS